jgi:response regulator RpfG family c-di-GMP phosphodiesterase
MAKARVLFVDDEPNVLSGFRRSLRNDFEIETAESGKEALRILEQSEPFGVIVSDCRMPEMDGVELLRRVSRSAPLSVRVMLTGNMDQDTAVRAVNTGEVFKFLNKPCDLESLRQVIGQAARQYELVTAEKELLEHTVKGSITVLADLLGIVKPEAFGRTARLRRKAAEVGAHLEGINAWELDAATLLSQLGCVNIDTAILDKVLRGERLGAREGADFAAHPRLGADLIGKIPRLERVATVILYQNKSFNGSGFPADDVKKGQIPLEARVLHAVLRYDDYACQGWSDAAIIDKLRKSPGEVDPGVLDALAKASASSTAGEVVRVSPSEVTLGMTVQEDIKTDQGIMLLCRGQEVTPAIREHLVKFHKLGALTKPLLVAMPAEPAAT